MDDLATLLRHSDRAAARLAELSSTTRKAIGLRLAAALSEQIDSILAANTLDLEVIREQQPDQPLAAVRLTPERLTKISESLRLWANQPDPLSVVTPLDGQALLRVQAPLGVIGWLYELYPEWLVAGISLALKTGNAIVLAGTTPHTQLAIVNCLSDAAYRAGLPEGAILAVDYDHGSGAIAILRQLHYLRLAVVCGRPAWAEALREQALMPTLVCGAATHVIYIGASAIAATALCRLGKDHESLFSPERFTVLLAEDFPDREAVVELLHTTPANLEIVPDVQAAITWCNRHAEGGVAAIWSDSWQELQAFRQRVAASLLYINQYPRPDLTAQRYCGAPVGVLSLRSPQRGLLLPEHLTTCKYVVGG